MIAPAPTVADEIVDVNHCHNLTIDYIQACLGTEHMGRLPVGYDLYGSQARASTRTHVGRNKGIHTKRIDRNRKEADQFTKIVSLPGFPEQLPELQADVEISVKFEDGTTRTWIDDKRYRYDLGSELELAPAEARLAK